MNRATRPALLNSQANPFDLRATLFHSSPVLDRRRRTHWDSGGGAFRDSSRRFNPYAKRFRKLQSKQTLLRNVSAFAEHLFQGWRSGFDEYDPSSSQGSSGFRHEYEAKGPWRSGFDEYDPFSSQGSSGFRHEYRAKGPKRAWTGTKGPHSTGRSTFHFCEDDDDVETIFRSAFGGNQYFYWSFIEEDYPRWRNSSGNYDNYRTSWNRRHQEEEDYDYSTDSDSSESDLASYRLVLGLSSSGPLRLDDVKNAYRTCALKWHPDRHQGSSKAVAEEKFKACSAAYQSLCDKMAFH